MTRPMVDVALCDDEIPEQKRLRGIVDAIFASAGFQARITSYNSLQDLRIALSARPHYAIVDNVFEGEDNAGIQFIAREKLEYPDIVFALMTGATFNVDQLGIRLPNPDIIGTKSHLVEKRYQEYLGAKLVERSKRYPTQSVFVERPESFPLGASLKDHELHSLVEQVVFESGLVDAADTLQAHLRPMTGGYSGAAVLELQLSGSSRSTRVPTVVKIAKRDWIATEIAAFTTFVKWQLPHSLRVDIVGTGETRDWGAIAYAFVLAGERATQTATEFLRRGSDKAVDRVVSDILGSKTTAWYRVVNNGGEELSRVLANSKEFDSRKDPRRDDAFGETIRRVAGSEDVPFQKNEAGFQLGSLVFPRVRRTVFQREWGATTECYSHGDLNSNNIILDAKATKVALIDFADAGRTQVFRDFVSFENSIRLEWPVEPAEAALTFAQLLEREDRALSGDFDQAPGYLLQVQKVRNVASELFPTADPRHYAICLALNTWKVNAVMSGPHHAQRRALAAYSACLSSLTR